MVRRVAETYDGGMQADKIIAEFLPAVEAEYGWWMKGADRLSDKDGVRAADHTVMMPGGEILNRYFDTKETPRTESYREDVITAVRLPRDKAPVVYRNIRATAESGRDMNGEAMDDPERLETAAAERLVPVELNSLLWEYEDFISRAYSSGGALEQAARYRELAEARAAAINKYCYTGDDKTGYYCGFKFMDLNFDYGTPSGYVAMTMAVPVSRGIAPAGRAESVCRKLTQDLLQTGGFVASSRETGQQWDWPNGWAPDQDEGVNALVRTAELTGNEVWRMWADAAKVRWLNHHAAIYRSVGKIAEKCNVCVSNPLDVQHGEYPLQYGFLWTNGIMRKFLASEIHGPAQWLIGDVPRP